MSVQEKEGKENRRRMGSNGDQTIEKKKEKKRKKGTHQPLREFGELIIQGYAVNHIRLFWRMVCKTQEEHSALEVVSPPSGLVLVLNLTRRRVPVYEE